MTAAISYKTGKRAAWHDEGRDLAARAHRGDRAARDALLERCMPFVKCLAKSWPKGRTTDMEDLVQAGALGVLHALRKWDGEANAGTFLTYAGAWIRVYMQRTYERDAHAMYVAINAVTNAQALAHRRAKMRSIGLGDDADPGIAKLDTPRSRLATVTLATPCRSLNQSGRDLGGRLFADAVGDASTPSPERAAAESEWRGRVQSMLQSVTLTRREKSILKNRILSDDPLRYEDLAKRFGCCREQVRNLEKKLRKKLGPALLAAVPEEIDGRPMRPLKLWVAPASRRV